ncbi:MAG: aminoglycoside phosphotransferase family protein [Clostridiales bacterium]|nr:aminoglycoside phosphotransferase family protein [Clostridiales bacterium]
MAYNDIKNILPRFRFEGEYVSSRELTSGNINETYVLEYRDGPRTNMYIIQKINTYVFRDPLGMMQNIAAVTEHLKASLQRHGGSAERQVLELVRTKNNDILIQDRKLGVWRAYTFITNALALDVVREPAQMEEVGRAFGRFQRNLADFPAEALFETIPHFHNTTKRFYAFVRAVDEDKAGRVREVEDEIEFLFDRRRMMGEIVRLLDRKVLPLRVTHNDTKSNNVLLDEQTGQSLAVIDLDTVMPGSSLYDYGDAVRFGASTAREDEEDTRLIGLDMEKTRAFTRGFVQETAGILSPEELSRLPLGIKVLTAELAMRFLTDYLDGDLYFKVNSPVHNLVRARAQMALLVDVERREEELHQMVQHYLARYA